MTVSDGRICIHGQPTRWSSSSRRVHWRPVLASGPAALRFSLQEVAEKMPREPHALISTSSAAATPERRHAERLSLRAAILGIGVLSLAGWAAIIALARALF